MFAIEADSTVFQFHYGTIKSTIKSVDTDNKTAFQFHYGTIKSPRRSRGLQGLFSFQFHYGTIKSYILPLFFQPHPMISIPLWYD